MKHPALAAGDRFGSLVILHKDPERRGSWICQCECGSIGHRYSCDLRSGRSRRCLTCRLTSGCKGVGRYVMSNGYVAVYVGLAHHLKMGPTVAYAYEHRVVGEKMLGRRLLPGEIVHHSDGNKQNNEASNLVVMTDREHRSGHRMPGSRLRAFGEENVTIDCACGCGGRLLRFDGAGRPRSRIANHWRGRKRVRSDAPSAIDEYASARVNRGAW